MRSTIIIILLIFSNASYTQSKFGFNIDGLSPESLTIEAKSFSQTELYTKTLLWIKATYEHPDRTIISLIANEAIQISGIKDNAIEVDKQYFYLKYDIKISFKKGQYSFEPLSIHTKINSKYDMGWQPVDLKNGASFYKKGKVIKKTKSYVKVIPEVLNELNSSFYNYLISE
ncbi:hypothetical protein [Hyunsoonleella rubra]|uniref:DUF4468 domain-containing protein n=1 Tax=Hyunsoonleella rubra TaxID=1737062 RepID=A0ABW5TCY0_9FLAO